MDTMLTYNTNSKTGPVCGGRAMVKKKIKVAILYRVLQGWRVPIFEKLNKLPSVEICVFHGKSFKKTKVVNYEGQKHFNSKCLPTIGVNLATKNGQAVMPINPTLILELTKFKPDIILCEGASNFINNYFAYIYKVLFKKKMIWWSLGEIKNRQKSLLRKIFDKPIQFLEKNMNSILAYSSFGTEYFIKLGIPKEKIFVAVNVIDTNKKKRVIKSLDCSLIYEEAHRNSVFNVLFVGALTKEKKVDILLKSFKKLETEVEAVHLTIVGDGLYKNNYIQLASELEIENVKFTGKIIDGISKYFIASDIFVLPGLGGLAVSDALVHGLPVIASIGDGCEKDLLSTGAGIIDENLTDEVLFKYLINLYKDPDKLNKMKKEAVNIIDNRFNINTYIDNVSQCINYTKKN